MRFKTIYFQDTATNLKKNKMEAYFNLKAHCASKNCIRYFYIFSKFLSFSLTTKTIPGNQHKFVKSLNELKSAFLPGEEKKNLHLKDVTQLESNT